MAKQKRMAQMGRPRRWAEDMQARFSAGTFKRIKAVLTDDEDRTDFVRAAVERELKRRERRSLPREGEDIFRHGFAKLRTRKTAKSL
jgi:hypothetical protein